ncbi:MAG: holo-ACP synthase [Puniceicoccales bacterium]|nr:holo-ACP synthase [Puniceicoccales bacterium]
MPACAAVLGVGIDLVETARVRRLLERYGDAFLRRVFTPEEHAYCMAFAKPWISLAARFAAKEAVSKAFGTGIGAELTWTSIGIVNDVRGAPSVVLDAKGTALLLSCGAALVHVSLSHTRAHAQAIALLCSAPTAALNVPKSEN